MTIFIGIGIFSIGCIVGNIFILSLYAFDDKGRNQIINGMKKMVKYL